MSLVRTRLAIRAAPRLRTPTRLNSGYSSLIAYRLLSTTARRSHAEPVNIKHRDAIPNHRVDPPHPHGTATYDSGKELNPYKGGPSAIDKAVHLFFFTEIIRGEAYMYTLRRWVSMVVNRNVDRVGEFLSRAIHNYVPI